MRYLAAIAAILTAFQAQAADKGAPATLDQIINLPSRQALSGCYVEVGGAGTFLAEGDRKASAALGLGCDFKIEKLFVIGTGIRGFTGDIDAGAFDVRLGMALNPNLTISGIASWRAKDWKINDVGQLYLGLGAETSLPVPGLSIAVEGTGAVSKFGAGATRDDVSTLLLMKYRPQ